LLIAFALVGCGSPKAAPTHHAATHPSRGDRSSDGGGATASGSMADAAADAEAEATASRSLDAKAATAGDLGTALVDMGEGDAMVATEPPDTTVHPLAVASLAAGYAHACAVSTSGALYCWGQNGFGQLGLGDTDDRSTPQRVGTQTDWTAVTTGRFHSCGIRAAQLFCWGSNGFGQASGGDPGSLLAPEPVVSAVAAWTSISAGDWHTCGLDDLGHAYCWGYDLLGRVGNGKGLGDMNDPGEAVTTPTAIDTAAKYIAIDAGAAHSCGVRDDGSLACWGVGDRGQVGTDATDMCLLNNVTTACSLQPRVVAASVAFTRVSAGGEHSCAITRDDELYCFGANDFGQLGTSDTQSTSSPQALAGDFVRVSAGGTHTCAVRSNGRLACFGNGESDQLGFTAASAPAPTDVPTDSGVVDVSAGALCTCAVGPLATGLCWGHCGYSDDPRPSAIVSP
jgi:alpha-tubulin suppressor-like RCC1 family protein